MFAQIHNLWLGTGVFLALFTADGLAQATQAPQPPVPRSTIQVDGVDREVITDARGWPHPRRKMIAYSAPQEQVLPRLEKRRAELAQYRDLATKPQ